MDSNERQLLVEICRHRLVEAERKYKEHPDPEKLAAWLKALNAFTDVVLHGKIPEK